MQRKRKEVKITQKRTTFFQKAYYILKPLVIYMLVKTLAQLLLVMTVVSVPLDGAAEFVSQNYNQINAVINGIASLVGVIFLVGDFLKEAAVSGEVDIDAGMARQFAAYMKNGFLGYEKVNALGLAVCAIFGAVSSIALNAAVSYGLELFQSVSERYANVEQIQYSVPLWLGIVLYGIIAPFAEELVFRGVTYNRMKRFYSIPRSIVVTALIFGAFHANLPQFLYGTCMGMLIALCYEKEKCFAAPVVFHMAANITVFALSMVI